MNMLRPSWGDRRLRDPRLALHDLASELGATEVELLARDCGRAAGLERVVRLKPAWSELLDALPRLGHVRAVTGHALGTVEQLGRYADAHGPRERGRRPGTLDLQARPMRWASAFALVAGALRGLCFFDEEGAAAHQIYLQPESDRRAFDALVAAQRHADQSAVQAVGLPRRQGGQPGAHVDVALLRRNWERSGSGAEPIDLAVSLGLPRAQILRLLGRRWARPVRPQALSLLLEAAAEAGTPLALTLDNGGARHALGGAILGLRREGGTTAICLPGAELWCRDDVAADAWVVEQPGRDGPCHWLELVDEDDAFLRIGARQRPGEPEPRAWRYQVRALLLDDLCRVEPASGAP